MLVLYVRDCTKLAAEPCINLLTSSFLLLSIPSVSPLMHMHASHSQQYRLLWSSWEHNWPDTWRYFTRPKEVPSTLLSARLPWPSTEGFRRRFHGRERFSWAVEPVTSFTLTCNPNLTPLLTTLSSTPDTHRGCKWRERCVFNVYRSCIVIIWYVIPTRCTSHRLCD
jgi:hypothetical protein